MPQQRQSALPLALAADEIDLLHAAGVLVGDALDRETRPAELLVQVIGNGRVAVGADRIECDQFPGDLDRIKHGVILLSC